MSRWWADRHDAACMAFWEQCAGGSKLESCYFEARLVDALMLSGIWNMEY
ncbi:hypothetical protein YSY43_37100 [Paenibacillus sp. YSY-4.3]